MIAPPPRPSSRALPALALLVAALVAGCGGGDDAQARGIATRAADEARTPAVGAEAAPEAVPVPASGAVAESATEVVVYKTSTCGCCSSWIEHLEEAGFQVTAHDEADLTAVKNQLGVPGPVRSCHTALVDGYLVEGHVPADVIRRLLDERPQVAGVAVPGMPIGSPGMEVPGRPADSYDVVTFDGRGRTAVYESR